MATNYVPQMIVQLLSNPEVNYELTVRNALTTSDNYERRRDRLSDFLNREVERGERPPIASPFSPEKDRDEILVTYNKVSTLVTYNRLIELYNKDGQCTDANIDQIETLIVHLDDRIKRILDLQISVELKPHAERIMNLYTEIRNFRGDDGTEEMGNGGSTPNGTKLKNTKSQPQVINLNHQQLIELIETSVNNIMNRRFPTNLNQSRRKSKHTDQSKKQKTLWSDSDSENSVHSVHSTHSQASFRSENFPPSSTHRVEQTAYKRINVLDWYFRFSGLERNEDHKSIDVDTFIQLVKDHGQAEGMTEVELMQKIQQLLTGPAADWYAHARQSISGWREFKQKLRSRFAFADTVDDIR